MINKFQQGGATQQGSILQQIQQLPEDQQKQIMQAFTKWAQQKGVDINQLQNNPQALEAALGQFIQEVQQASQGQQTLAARHGTKLNYIKALKNQCPDGYEPFYYKKGGMVKCGCSGKKFEDGGKTKKEDAVTKFKKTVKARTGTAAPQPKPKSKNDPVYHKGRTKLAEKYPVGRDTVHVNGRPYSLTNDEGQRLNTSYPEYGKKLYQADLKSKKKDAKARVQKADEISTYKCGNKVKKHNNGGSLNGIPFIRKVNL